MKKNPSHQLSAAPALPPSCSRIILFAGLLMSGITCLLFDRYAEALSSDLSFVLIALFGLMTGVIFSRQIHFLVTLMIGGTKGLHVELQLKMIYLGSLLKAGQITPDSYLRLRERLIEKSLPW